jgi:hypothetical protein
VDKSLSERFSLVARFDRLFQPSPAGDNISYIPFSPEAPARLYLGAVEFRVNRRLRLTPNAIIIDYDRDEQGNQPRTDVQARLTMFLNFE